MYKNIGGSMQRKMKFTQVGDKLCLIFDHDLLSALNADKDTIFEIKITNAIMTLTVINDNNKNVSTISDNPKVQKAYHEVIEEYNETLEKLSKK